MARKFSSEISSGQTVELSSAGVLQAIEDMAIGFYAIDSEWRYVYVNRCAADIIGVPVERMLGGSFWDHIPEDVLDEVRAYYEAARETGQIARRQQFVPSLNKWYAITIHPQHQGFWVFFRDVTNERVAEERLQLHERALHSIAQGVTITTMESGTIVYANPAFAAMTGYDLAELIGRKSLDFLPAETSKVVVEDIIRAAKEQRPCDFESQFIRRDGRTFLNRFTCTPVAATSSEKTAYFVTVHEDVTEARAQDARLRESQKMESLGRLTGGIAHDFNNILTVIRSNAEDLRDELQSHAFLRGQAEMVLQASLRGTSLIKQLLAVARKQELRLKVVDLDSLFGNLTALLGRTLGENIRINVSVDVVLPPVRIDPNALENALLNLAINARDAMPNGGTITLEATTFTADENYARAHPEARPGTYVAIAVVDTGTGMPDDVVKRAFEPFFTTKELGKGTGLGLSMVHGFAQQCGGHARIDTKLGHGTAVRLFIPSADAPVSVVTSLTPA